MKIGINGRFLAAKRTGVQRAAYNLIQALVQVDKVNDYVLFAPSDEIDNADWSYENVSVIPAKIKTGDNLRNHFWEQFTLPRLARKYEVDILHSPANLAPLFYSGRSIVHIHDLCFVVNPQWYSFTFRTAYNFAVPRLAKRATRVTTNSNNSRNDLLQFCNLSSEKVSQVYWAVDDLFLEPSSSDSEEAELRVGNELEDYILYVGSLEPRKNIGTLLKAYESLRLHNPAVQSKLVLIGGESPLFADVRLQVQRFKEDIIFKGFVNDKMLRAFYRQARLFVYPSLYEGFGLPPLEAMASGVPVVTSVSSSIPEVVGEAALMVSPYDHRQLAGAMERLLTDQPLRELMIEKGREQVKKFNWYRVARNTLAVYHEVYNLNRPGINPDEQVFPYAKWSELRTIEDAKLAALSASR